MFPYFYISAFYSMIDRPTDKMFIKYKLIYERNVHNKTLGVYPPKPYGHTDRRTDIYLYRVALLLKKLNSKLTLTPNLFALKSCPTA